jgi:hypothetical protein
MVLATSVGETFCGFEPLGLAAFTDVVPPAFASIGLVHGDEGLARHLQLYPLSYEPMASPEGFEPPTCSPTGIRRDW